MPGPPPTPTEVLKKRGSWRAGTREGEPKLTLSKPRVPKGLSKKGKARFQRLASDLFEMRVSSDKDDASLFRYCQLWDQYEQLYKHIEANGTTSVKANGDVVGSAEFNQWIKVCDSLLKLEVQFGLTPSARTRLRVVDPPKVNEPKRSLKSFKIG